MKDHKVLRIILLASVLLAILGVGIVTVALLLARGSSTALGDEALLGLILMSNAMGAGWIFSGILSAKLGRNFVLWVMGSMCLPVLIPLLLVFMNEKVYSPPAGLKEEITGAMRANALRSQLLSSAVCPKCAEISEISSFHGKELRCDTCREKLVRFTSASQRSRTCANCGLQFGEKTITVDDSLADGLGGVARGLECLKCGQGVCAACAGKDAGKKLTYICSCGGELAVRI